jgi:hypothetical protein
VAWGGQEGLEDKNANKKAAQSAGRLGGEACDTAHGHEKIMHKFEGPSPTP